MRKSLFFVCYVLCLYLNCTHWQTNLFTSVYSILHVLTKQFKIELAWIRLNEACYNSTLPACASPRWDHMTFRSTVKIRKKYISKLNYMYFINSTIILKSTKTRYIYIKTIIYITIMYCLWISVFSWASFSHSSFKLK